MPFAPVIPLPVHAALRLATGLLTMLLPFLAGFDTAAMVLSVTLGTLVVGVSFAASGAEQADRSVLPPTSQESLDYTLVLALTGVAVVLAATGSPLAAALLTVVALVQLAGNLLTDYRTA